MSGSRTEEKREEAKRWRFQQNAGSAATSAAGATIRAVLPAMSARMKRKWERKRLLRGIRILPAAAGTVAAVETAAVGRMAAAAETAAAVVNVMHGIS